MRKQHLVQLADMFDAEVGLKAQFGHDAPRRGKGYDRFNGAAGGDLRRGESEELRAVSQFGGVSRCAEAVSQPLRAPPCTGIRVFALARRVARFGA
jgi:hypothetical protein